MPPLRLLRITSEHVAIDRSGGLFFQFSHSDRASANAAELADTSTINIASHLSMSSCPSVPHDGRSPMRAGAYVGIFGDQPSCPLMANSAHPTNISVKGLGGQTRPQK